jgi:hypothetical protein
MKNVTRAAALGVVLMIGASLFQLTAVSKAKSTIQSTAVYGQFAEELSGGRCLSAHDFRHSVLPDLLSTVKLYPSAPSHVESTPASSVEPEPIPPTAVKPIPKLRRRGLTRQVEWDDESVDCDCHEDSNPVN